MDLSLWVASASAALAGLLIGGVCAWQWTSRRAEVRVRRLLLTAREQYVAGTQALRATNERLQSMWDAERVDAQTRLDSLTAAHRLALSKVEAQLRFAYAEIDRMHGVPGEGGAPLENRSAPASGEASGTSPQEGGEGNGFAATRPMSI